MEAKLKKLREKIQSGQMEEVRLKEALKNKQNRRLELVQKCQEKGYNPEDLQSEIDKRTAERDILVARVEDILAGKKDNRQEDIALDNIDNTDIDKTDLDF